MSLIRKIRFYVHLLDQQIIGLSCGAICIFLARFPFGAGLGYFQALFISDFFVYVKGSAVGLAA
jgi:hypothetical protein